MRFEGAHLLGAAYKSFLLVIPSGLQPTRNLLFGLFQQPLKPMFCAQPFGTPEGVPLQRGYRHCEIALEEKQVLDRILAIRASRDSAGRPDGLMAVFRGN